MGPKFHFWNIFFLLFFVAAAAGGYLWLAEHDRLGGIRLLDLLLIALAAQRLTRLFAYDVVLQFFRSWFYGAPENSLRHTMGALLGCPWCTGLWFALLLTFLYYAFTPIAWYGILVLALSSLASTFQLIANYLGWSAEVKKREALGSKSY